MRRMSCCEWLTKSYHIQLGKDYPCNPACCEWLTKSYHIQQEAIKSLYNSQIEDHSQKKSCIMIDEIPLKGGISCFYTSEITSPKTVTLTLCGLLLKNEPILLIFKNLRSSLFMSLVSNDDST